MKATPALDELFEKADPFTCQHQGAGVNGCPTCDGTIAHVAAAYRWRLARRDHEYQVLQDQLVQLRGALAAAEDPVPLLLWCPGCGERHIDEGEQVAKPHRTHACQSCGMLWAPAAVPTIGVRFLPGCKNAVAA